MIRNILAVFAGIITAWIIIYLIEMLGHQVYPVPEGLNVANMEEMAEYVKGMPFGAFLFVLLSWAAGSFAAGIVASAIAEKYKILIATIISAVFMVFGIVNMLLIPHPIWFWIVGLLMFIPFGFLGGRVGIKIGKK